LVSQNDLGESHLDFYRRWHKLAGPYFQWQMDQVKPSLGRRVADIGCGPGNLTSQLMDRDYYLGVDNDVEILAELDRQCGKSDIVETMMADISHPGIVDILKQRNIDSIMAVNFLAHLQDDEAALRYMVEALPKGGTLCLIAEAMPALFGTLDDLDGHYRRYTKSMLQERLEKLDVVLEQLYYFNIVGALGWWLKSRVLKEESHSDGNYKAMNLLIPIFRPLENAIKPPLGLSLVAIARRR